ncbi:MAG TPA: recombinase family protein [Clostridiaceae bacterium]|nr:recombinase family protein [Clostridiaceae bacterium]
MMELKYKVGIYTRESRDDNDENYETIETQRDLLIEFVKRNKLGEVFRVYIDNNVSGSAFEREGLNQLKDDIINRRIDLLVVKDLSRLGRNNAKTLLFLDFIEEHGVRLLTYDGKYDSLKDNDTVGIETWINERYLKDTSRKIRASLRFKIERGEYIGNAPYGYVKSMKEKNKLEIDEETAPVVREIFNLYKRGYGYAYIARILNERGYPPPSNRTNPGSESSSGWNPVAIQRILSNRVYIGDTVQGISEKISYKSKKTRRLPRSDWVITEGTHEAIIDKEDFEQVQKIRMGRRANPISHKGDLHLFSGIIYCGACGSPMFARKRKGRPLGYICGNYSRNGKAACTSHHIRESMLKEIIIKEILKLYSCSEAVEEAQSMLEEKLVYLDTGLSRCETLRQQLSSKEKHQEILYMDRLEGRISEELFERMNRSIQSRIEQLKSEIARIEQSAVNETDAAELIEFSKKAVSQGFLTREMVRLIVNRIDIFESGDTYSQAEENCNYEYTDYLEDSLNTEGAVVVDFKLKKIYN